LFDLFDDQHQGKISKKDFLTHLSILCNGTVEEKAELAFKAYDANSDGFLTREELKNAIQHTFNSVQRLKQGSNIKPTVQKKEEEEDSEDDDDDYDEEEEEELEDSEVKCLIDEAFKADKNQDGKLSLDEWKSYATTNAAISGFLSGGVITAQKFCSLGLRGRILLGQKGTAGMFEAITT